MFCYHFNRLFGRTTYFKKQGNVNFTNYIEMIYEKEIHPGRLGNDKKIKRKKGEVKFFCLGPNGAGKTTLFRLITGQEKTDSGLLRIGETAKLAYVDQSRDVLDPEKTI